MRGARKVISMVHDKSAWDDWDVVNTIESASGAKIVYGDIQVIQNNKTREVRIIVSLYAESSKRFGEAVSSLSFEEKEAFTALAPDWHGTGEELIYAAKELS
jgi:hypothetical protein